MHIGIIGAGNVGTTLAGALRRAGHQVTFGLRTPERDPSAVSIPELARRAEALVLATPFDALESVAGALRGAPGKVLVDASNPLLPGLRLAVGHTDSGAETLQRALPAMRVTKCFNTVGVEVMDNPVVAGARATMFLAGDDASARAVTASLAKDLGFEPVDVGALERARLLEPAAVLWIHLAMVEKLGRRMALRLEPASQPATPAKTRRPTVIAVIGSGHIGAGLVRAWTRAGHSVVMGVRRPDDADVQRLAKETGARVKTVTDAVSHAEVVTLALPAQGVSSLVGQGSLAGKLLLDCTNFVGPGFTLQYGLTTSWAEEVARLFPDAKVFKSFNAQGAENLALPRSEAGPAANFFCGDDPGAREVVETLVADVGFAPVFAGPLTRARSLEPLMMLWVQASRALQQRALGFRLLREPD